MEMSAICIIVKQDGNKARLLFTLRLRQIKLAKAGLSCIYRRLSGDTHIVRRPISQKAQKDNKISCILYL